MGDGSNSGVIPMNSEGNKHLIIKLPNDWDKALKRYRDARSEVADILEYSWHHAEDSMNYPIEGIPKRLYLSFQTPEGIHYRDFIAWDQLLKHKKWFKSLLRLVFNQSLLIMGYEKSESNTQNKRFGSLLKGMDMKEGEIDLFLGALKHQPNGISFSNANRYAWGSIKKDLKISGIEIIDDTLMWYLQGIIDRLINKKSLEKKES